MSKGGGGGSQSGTSTSEPWKAAQPFLTDVMRQAQGTYNANTGARPSGYAPMSGDTTAALDAISGDARANLATGNPLVQQAETAYGGILNQTNPGTSYVGSVASGQQPLGSQQARGLFEAATQGNLTNQQTGNLGEIAAGGANPHLDRAFQAAARPVTDAVKSAFFGQGSGSAYQQDVLQRGLGDLAAQIYMPAYESDANRRLSAAQTQAGLGESALDRRLGSAGVLEAAAGGDVATRLGAAGQVGDMNAQRAGTQLGAIGALPGIQGAGMQDAQNLLTSGAIRDADTQRWLDELMARYNEPFSQLGQYANIIQGFGGLGGTTTSKTKDSPGLFDWINMGLQAL